MTTFTASVPLPALPRAFDRERYVIRLSVAHTTAIEQAIGREEIGDRFVAPLMSADGFYHATIVREVARYGGSISQEVSASEFNAWLAGENEPSPITEFVRRIVPDWTERGLSSTYQRILTETTGRLVFARELPGQPRRVVTLSDAVEMLRAFMIDPGDVVPGDAGDTLIGSAEATVLMTAIDEWWRGTDIRILRLQRTGDRDLQRKIADHARYGSALALMPTHTEALRGRVKELRAVAEFAAAHGGVVCWA